MGQCIAKSSKSTKKTTGVIAPPRAIQIKKANFRLHYKIEEKIGEDYSGTVFRVTDKVTKESRALKSIPLDPSQADSILHEVSILQLIDHPNIIKIVDVYLELRSVNIITELCTGGELFEKITQFGSFTETILCKYAKQILSGLIYLHNQGVVHKQLNPENILLSDTSEDSELKIIDFGRNKKEKQLIYFKAPEAFSGDYSKASDIWSLGVIFYLMASGKIPFEEVEDPQQYYINIKANPVEFKGRSWEKLSLEFKELVKSMLDVNPDKRPSARGVYEHEWIAKHLDDGGQRRLSKRSLAHLSKYTKKSKFKRALLGFMMNKTVVQDKIKRFQAIFKSMDKNGDGILSIDEIFDGIRKANIIIENPLKLIKTLDTDKSGEISYSEFLTSMIDWEKELSIEKITKAFNEFDLDKDGFISSDEFMAVLGTDYCEREFANFMKEADLNGDGKIDLQELCIFLRKG